MNKQIELPPIFIQWATKSARERLTIKSPYSHYESYFKGNNPYPKGHYFFKAGGPSDPPDSVVFYKQRLGTDDLARVVVPNTSTLVVTEDTPEAAKQQAKALGLKVTF